MSAKVLMGVAEYLRTGFDGSDCEYLDGEIVERNWGDLPHGDTQGNLLNLLHQLRPKLGIRVLPEITIKISPTRYRVADLAVWRNDDIGTGIPTAAPFLVIEILSPKTAWSACCRKSRNISPSASNGSGSSTLRNKAPSSIRRKTPLEPSATSSAPKTPKSKFLSLPLSTSTPELP